MCLCDSDPSDGFGVEWSGLLSHSLEGLAAGGRYPGGSVLHSLNPGGRVPKPKAVSLGLTWPGPPPRESDGTLSVSGVLMISCKRGFFISWCWNGSQGLVYMRQGALPDVGA